MRKDPLYFIAILLPEELGTEITAFKKHIAGTWGPRHALRSPPHITLQPPFAWPGKRLSELQACLKAFAYRQKHFHIQLKNFDVFPPRVIFVKPLANLRMEQIHRHLKQALETNLGLKDARKEQPFHPHVTIAHRDVEAGSFALIWDYFKALQYERVFEVNGICLLQLADGKWQVQDNFLFE